MEERHTGALWTQVGVAVRPVRVAQPVTTISQAVAQAAELRFIAQHQLLVELPRRQVIPIST